MNKRWKQFIMYRSQFSPNFLKPTIGGRSFSSHSWYTVYEEVLIMSNPLLEQYIVCDTIVKALLWYTPIWSKSSGENVFKIFLQYYSSILGVIGSYSLFNKAFNASDLNIMTAYLIPAIALCMNVFKLMPTVFCEKTFSDIYQELNELFRYYCTSTTVIPIEDNTLRLFGVTMKFLSLNHKLIVINYMFVPIIIVIYQIISNIQPAILLLPYSGVYPGNLTDKAVSYTIQYLLEATTVMISAPTSVGADCFFGLAVFQMTGILSAVSQKVCIADQSKDYVNLLDECIDIHCQLIECSRKIQSIYGQMIMTQRLTDGIILCAAIFQMHKITDLGMTQLTMCGSWIILKFIQQLTYGWYGSLLISESEKLQYTIYSSNWPDFYNRKFMKHIVYVLQQKPIKIEAFGFFVISIPMASSVISASFSYFFLLQSFDTLE